MSYFRQLRSEIHRIFRFCIHCGSWGGQDSLLCSACQNLLMADGLASKSDFIEGLKTVYCFDWVPDQNRMLSIILKELKDSLCLETFNFYGTLMAASLRQDSESGWVIVPCPASHSNRLHSQRLAAAIGKMTGIAVKDILIREDERSNRAILQQKKLSRKERSKIHIVSSAEITFQNVIFIDDIITTGSTALAAYRALGQPKQFIVHTLSRRRLAGTPLIC